MTAPQGLAYFAGIQSLLSASMTLTHGISPSVATLTIPPQPGRLLKGGPLIFSYGRDRITLPDCTIDSIHISVDSSGRTVWNLSILDRRWKWKFAGRVSGYYNVRRGDRLVAGTEKSPRELAAICLRAMGETRYDVSRLPDDPRPEVEWDYDLPAEALARLCDSLGCRVILRLSNAVSIERVGVGRQLPLTLDTLSRSVEVDPPERPDELRFVAGRTRFQADFELEPMGREIDGTVKPLIKTSFTPVSGGRRTWLYADPPNFNNVYGTKPSERAKRELAKANAFRLYRIKTPFKLPYVKGSIPDLDRILPVETVQVEMMDVDGRPEPRPAWVYGRWYAGVESGGDVESTVDGNLPNKPRGLYTRPFRILQQTGLLEFQEPIYRQVLQTKPVEGRLVYPADIRLRVAVSLRNNENRGWLREEVRRKLPGPKSGTEPRYIRRDDVCHNIYYDHVKRRTTGNIREVKDQAKYYLDATEREYQLSMPQSVSLAGLKPISPDGAIQQVTWTISEEGFATTQIARNKEEALVAPSYKEKRFIERLKVEEQKQHETERQRNRRREKAQA
jgi:hypothetical protein